MLLPPKPRTQARVQGARAMLHTTAKGTCVSRPCGGGEAKDLTTRPNRDPEQHSENT